MSDANIIISTIFIATGILFNFLVVWDWYGCLMFTTGCNPPPNV
jgi:hypothetical protein